MSGQRMTELALFKGREIRKTLHEGAWWFAIVDVVAVLTDSMNPADYLKKMRKRDPELNALFKGGGQTVPPLALPFVTAGGTQRVQCWNTEGLLTNESIQSSESVESKRGSVSERRV